MASKQKYYAVKKGNKVGIFSTWSDCQEAIKGFSSPEFKSFESEEEAIAYINDEDIVLANDINPRLEKGEVVAFTDGSFDLKSGKYSSGVCIFAPNDIYQELSSKGNNEKYIDLHNVAGEIIAVFNAIDWAWKNGYDNITIFHDYEGISKWATGEWQANKNLSQFYKKYIDDKKDMININFVKVSGHSNNKYNDRADILAKNAISDNKIMRDIAGNNGYIISSVKSEDVTNLLSKLSTECSGLKYDINDEGKKIIWSIQLNREKVTMSLYNNIKLVVQGKKSNLFQIITSGIIENIKCGDFIKILKDAYGIAIDKEKVESDFKNILPSASNINMPENITLLLKQAIINLSNPASNDSEFSMYTFPALRALEGVLKYNLAKCQIPVNLKFDMFENKSGIYKLKPLLNINLPKNIETKLENCYNHLNNNRHTLFHFGVIIGGIDTNTRLLRTKEEANNIIKETLKIIDENYLA